MNETPSKFVSDQYQKGENVFSSRSSECYLAYDLAGGGDAFLWLLRFPIEPKSEQSKLFHQRLMKIDSTRASRLAFLHYGVDSLGTAYLVTEHKEVSLLLDSTWVPFELEELFVKALKAVVELHAAGITLEDVSESSFLRDANDEVFLGAVLGDFTAGAKRTAMLPSPESLQYVAPEQKVGGASSSRSDVFALGVFGYRLFTGRYMHGERSTLSDSELNIFDAPSPSSVRSDLPNWVDDVLGKCLETNPSKRYSDAKALLDEITTASASGVAPGGTNPWSRKTSEVSEETIASVRAGASKELVKVDPKKRQKAQEEYEHVDEEVLENTEKSKTFRTALIWIFSLGTGLGIAAFLFFSIGSKVEPTPQIVEEPVIDPVQEVVEAEDPILFMAEYAPEQLKEFIYIVASKEEPLDQRQSALAVIAESSDPTSYGILASLIQNSPSVELRAEATRQFIVKIERDGLTHSARVLNYLLPKMASESNGASIVSKLLRSVDSGRPMRARLDSLRSVRLEQPSAGLQLAAALASDTNSEEFIAVLRDFLSTEGEGVEVSEKSLGALLLSHPDLSSFVNGNKGEVAKAFSDQDLLWALEKSANGTSDKKLLRGIAEEIQTRKVLSPIQTIFIDALLSSMPSGQDSHQLANELVQGALGTISVAEVQNFARWDSLEVEPVLLAITATAKKRDAAVQAFDILARRTFRDEAAEALVNWVKDRFWDYRKRIVPAIGILSLPQHSTDAELSKAFDALLPFAKGGLFNTIAATKNRFLQLESIKRLGEITSSEELVGLLDSEDPEVRKATVKALRDRNELVVLQNILKAFKREKNEEVRNEYRKYHWVTRDRADR